MEQLAINNRVISEIDLPEVEVIPEIEESTLYDTRFIGSNTQEISYSHLKNQCIIPNFADNEPTISHQEFIDIVGHAAQLAFQGERISDPIIRVSHPIRGRVASAMGKPANELQEFEITRFYERMAFMFNIPSISESINGNHLCLSVGGVRAYNMENLYSKRNLERFKIYIGFENHVCTNLVVSTDGFLEDLRVRTLSELFNRVVQLFRSYSFEKELRTLESLSEYSLSEHQFAQLVGRLRMYQFLKPSEKIGIPPLMLGDSQVNTVIKTYYGDKSFKRDSLGSIDLWKFYNCLTGANKSSYIDTFLDRTVNALSFTGILLESLKTGKMLWYLDGQ